MTDETETPSEAEAFYDAEIAPALAALARTCAERGMNFVAVVEHDFGKVGLTRIKGVERAGPQFRVADTAARALGNVDSLILALIEDGREHGHNSMCLHQLTRKPR